MPRCCLAPEADAGASIVERWSLSIESTSLQAAIISVTSADILLQRAWIFPLLKIQKLDWKGALEKLLRSILS